MGKATADHFSVPLGRWLVVAGLGGLLLVPLSAAWSRAADLGHGWAAPLLMAYLWWERWAERPGWRDHLALLRNSVRCSPPRERRDPCAPAQGYKERAAVFSCHRQESLLRLGLHWGWWAAVVATGVVALPLRLLLTPYPLWPALVWAYVLLLVGLALAAAWLVAGRAGVRWLGGPLTILPAVVPWPTRFEQGIILPLREAMAGAAAEVLNLFAHPALAAGTSVRLGAGWVGIDEACGGVRSLQACVMTALFFGEWYRFPWCRRLALLGAGVAAALLGNFLRVLFLARQAGAEGSAAVESAHDTAGWIALGASMGVVGLLACCWGGYRWPAPRTGTARAAAVAMPAPGSTMRAGLWLGLVTALLLANEVGTRWWFARGDAQRATLPQWSARFPENHWSFRPEPLANYARDMLRPDAYLAGHWQTARDVRIAAYYIEWRQGQTARSIPFLHNPTVCLPFAGCELVGPLGNISLRRGGNEVPFHGYRFRRAGEEFVVAFTIWDFSRARPLEPVVFAEGWRAWIAACWADVRDARQHQPAQLLAVAVMGDGDLEQLLEPALDQLVSAP